MRFGSVEGALEHAAEVERKMYRESLQNNRDQILLSKKLATIHTNVPVPLDLPALAIQEPDIPALREIFQKLDFISLLRDLPSTPKPEAERTYRALEADAELEGWFGNAPIDAPVGVAVGEMMSDTVLGLSLAAGVACSDPHVFPARARVGGSRFEVAAAPLSASVAREARRHVVRVSSGGRSGRLRPCGAFRKTSGQGAGAGTSRSRGHNLGAVPEDAPRVGGAQSGGALRDDRSAAHSRPGGDGDRRHPHRSSSIGRHERSYGAGDRRTE